MNETVTKRFLLYFRLMMVVWILIANAFFHAIGFEYSWLIFLSNIMLFTMEGDIKDRFISVELGGLVGMVLTVLAMLAIGALTPVLGGMLGLLLGTLAIGFIMMPANHIITPYFTGWPTEAVDALLLPGILPFNLLKAGLNSVVTFLLYKTVSRYIVHGEGWSKAAPQKV